MSRLDQLLSILKDPDIQDGAAIQLSATGTYSLSENAARDSLAGIDALRLTAPHSADAAPTSRKTHL